MASPSAASSGRKRQHNAISVSKKAQNGSKNSRSKKKRTEEDSGMTESAAGVRPITSAATPPSARQGKSFLQRAAAYLTSPSTNIPPPPSQHKRPSVQTTKVAHELSVPPPPFGGRSDSFNVVARSLQADDSTTHGTTLDGTIIQAMHNGDGGTSISKKVSGKNSSSSLGPSTTKTSFLLFFLLCITLLCLVGITSLWFHQSTSLQLELTKLQQEINDYQMRVDAYEQALDGMGAVATDGSNDDVDQTENVDYWKALLQQEESRMDGMKKECDEGLRRLEEVYSSNK